MFQDEEDALNHLERLFNNTFWAENIYEDDDPHTEPVLNLLNNFTGMNYSHAIQKVIEYAPKEKQDLINSFLHSRIVNSYISNDCIYYIEKHFQLFPYLKTENNFILSLFDFLFSSEISFDKINHFCSVFDIQIPKNKYTILNRSISHLRNPEKIQPLVSYLNQIGFTFNENDPDVKSLTAGERICIQAIDCGNVHFVKEIFPLLNRKHPFIFIVACEQSHFKSEPLEKQADLAQWLIEQGYDANNEKNIILTASRGDNEVCLVLLEHGADLLLMKEHAHDKLKQTLALYELNHTLSTDLIHKDTSKKIKL